MFFLRACGTRNVFMFMEDKFLKPTDLPNHLGIAGGVFLPMEGQPSSPNPFLAILLAIIHEDIPGTRDPALIFEQQYELRQIVFSVIRLHPLDLAGITFPVIGGAGQEGPI